MSIWRPGDPIESRSGKNPVYARSGDEIPQEIAESLNPKDWPPPTSIEQMAEAARMWLYETRNINRDGLKLRSISDYPYNCAGMIFANRRVLVDIEHIHAILEHDGYRPIIRDEVVAGDLVLYRDQDNNPSHIALVIDVIDLQGMRRIRVISKWGLDPEFEHFEEAVHVPGRLGRPIEYFTEREPYEPERHESGRYIRRTRE